jgi:GTP-binding protein
LAELYERLEPFSRESTRTSGAREAALQLAIVGRPNVGKSTMVNRLIGEERMLTGPEAGITRDAIATDWVWEGRPLRLFDTAGLRRKSRVEGKLEQLSVFDALRSIRFAETVILVFDALQPLHSQDLTIARLVEKEGRALVLAANKWDAIEHPTALLQNLREQVSISMPQLHGVTVVPVSGLTGFGLDSLMTAVSLTDEVWNRRVATADLNRWLETAQQRHPPPLVAGRRLRLRYITQVNIRPPTFALFASKPGELPESYRRYLINRLRHEFDLPGTPIRMMLRKGRNPYAR